MIQFGNDKIKDIYFGSDKIKEVYYGSEKVWGEIVSIQEGYWVHKDTGVITYFGLEEPSIVDGIMGRPSWRHDCSEVQIPSGVTGLRVECFAQSEFLTSVTLPEGVTSLGHWCFRSCYSLTSVTLPESVTSLGDGCFGSCYNLTSVTLPESVTSIGGVCFTECYGLTSITIPESVTSIGEQCFYSCAYLTLVTVLPAIPPSLGYGVFDYVDTSFNIKVRSPYVDDYKTATNWNAYASKISAI